MACSIFSPRKPLCSDRHEGVTKENRNVTYATPLSSPLPPPPLLFSLLPGQLIAADRYPKQCTRLGRQCDYSHKVIFKDETPKVINRYVEVEDVTAEQWDREWDAMRRRSHAEEKVLATTHRWSLADSLRVRDDDVLPPFATLTTDEDRQKKAAYRPPGTYFIVATPSSFAELDEYRQPPAGYNAHPLTLFNELVPGPIDASDDQRQLGVWMAPIRERYQARRDFHSGYGPAPATDISVDPETLILGTIEESPHRLAQWSLVSSPSADFSGPDTSSPQSPQLRAVPHGADHLHITPEQYPRHDQPDHPQLGGDEERLIAHYRTYVRRHLIQVQRDPAGGTADMAGEPDLLEQEAAQFPPVSQDFRGRGGMRWVGRTG